MFLGKPKIWNSCLTTPPDEKIAVLAQLWMNDIDKKFASITIKKEWTTLLALHHLFKKDLDLTTIKDADPENPLELW